MGLAGRPVLRFPPWCGETVLPRGVPHLARLGRAATAGVLSVGWAGFEVSGGAFSVAALAGRAGLYGVCARQGTGAVMPGVEFEVDGSLVA